MLYSSDAVRSAVAPLLGFVSQLSGVTSADVGRVAERLLALPPEGEGERGGRSIVTGEGLPLEYSISVSHKGLRHRLMGDPASVLSSAPERHARARHTLMSLCEEMQSSRTLAEACHGLLRHMVRADGSTLSQYPAGAFWLATPLTGAGIALFISADIPEGNPRDCLAQAIIALLPTPAPALRLLAALQPYARVVSVALEGSTPENARLKLYWRLRIPRRLSEMGVPLLEHNGYSDFLAVALGRRELSADGFLIDAGFALTSGDLVDSKLFLCGHCLNYSVDEWQALLDDLIARYKLPSVPALGLQHHKVDISFICFGIDNAHRPRLNLYFKPRHSRQSG